MVSMAVMLMATAIYQSHRQARQAAIKHAGNITLVTQRGLLRHFAFFDSTLAAIGERYRQVLHFPVTNDQLGSLLFSGAQSNDFIVETAVLDAHGHLVSASRKASALLRNEFSDMPFFLAHRDNPASKLFISRPIRLSPSYSVIVLSRRIDDAQGVFAGVAMMVLDLSYLRWMLEGVDVGDKGSFAIYSKDGTPYMRVPYEAGVTPKALSNNPEFAQVKKLFDRDSGTFSWKSVNDGLERLYAFHVITGTDLVVFAGYSNAAIYGFWNITLVILLVASALFIVSGIYFSRQLAREFIARHATEKALENMAHTDRLTGLTNRHQLDQTLAAQWHAWELGRLRQLSVIFLDVDFFKLYNDFYGHLEGDKVLQQIAVQLRASVLREDDLAARYGGEEFVVVLPGADALSAAKVAERIRAAIAALAIPHARSSIGHVTVSLGVASADRGQQTRVEDLLASADQALYRAKSRGRNTVEAAALASVS